MFDKFKKIEDKIFTEDDIVFLYEYLEEFENEAKQIFKKEKNKVNGRSLDTIRKSCRRGKIAEIILHEQYPQRFVKVTKKILEDFRPNLDPKNYLFQDLFDLERNKIIELKAWSEKSLLGKTYKDGDNLSTLLRLIVDAREKKWLYCDEIIFFYFKNEKYKFQAWIEDLN